MADLSARHIRGIGLPDLVIALVIASLLMSLAIPAYNGFVVRAKNARAIGDIGSIQVQIERFRLKNNDRVPLSLNELDFEVPVDPWGQPYEFLNIFRSGAGVGGLRRDGQLNPLNTDYDLYSRGEDGSTSGSLSASASRDDIVRANNGAYIGLGEDY